MEFEVTDRENFVLRLVYAELEDSTKTIEELIYWLSTGGDSPIREEIVLAVCELVKRNKIEESYDGLYEKIDPYDDDIEVKPKIKQKPMTTRERVETLLEIDAEIIRYKKALWTIAKWDFDIQGDCVDDARKIACEALGLDEFPKGPND